MRTWSPLVIRGSANQGMLRLSRSRRPPPRPAKFRMARQPPLQSRQDLSGRAPLGEISTWRGLSVQREPSREGARAAVLVAVERSQRELQECPRSRADADRRTTSRRTDGLNWPGWRERGPERELYAEMLASIAVRMTPKQIVEAGQSARGWRFKTWEAAASTSVRMARRVSEGVLGTKEQLRTEVYVDMAQDGPDRGNLSC